MPTHRRRHWADDLLENTMMSLPGLANKVGFWGIIWHTGPWPGPFCFEHSWFMLSRLICQGKALEFLWRRACGKSPWDKVWGFSLSSHKRWLYGLKFSSGYKIMNFVCELVWGLGGIVGICGLLRLFAWQTSALKVYYVSWESLENYGNLGGTSGNYLHNKTPS